MTIQRLAFIGVLLTYFLIVFGGYVASSNSGMGCGPEWPLCNGEVVPALKGATLIEYMHRIIGALLGFLSILLFFKLFFTNVGQTVRFVGLAMLGLLIIQILLGAIVVVRDLPSIIITIHLIIAMLFLACLIWIWRYPGHEEGESGRGNLGEGKQGTILKHLNILLFLLIMTLAFGAYIKHQSYGLSCGWLGCKQSFFPMTTPELLQSIHRGLALLTTLYILLLTYWSFLKGWGRSLQRRFVLSTLTVISQLAIGAGVIMTTINIPLAVFHLAVATVLFVFISEARFHVGNMRISTSLNRMSRGNWQSGRRSLD
ncbi:COX15/CtaA family protein [Neobacillus drentensis]|uniref:COX15/CtaA family protein n=1 Tax=Neobacillus drentensis TaxID=220684 RepID=UPI0030016FFD